MALTERSRATLYRRLSDLIHDEEAVGEMLSNFPAHGLDEPATKDFVEATVADLRTEIQASANRLIIWFVSVNTAMVGLVLAITRVT